ncbi:uncharacterized protein PHALS_04827 [Plasmopara halstedii]|uniref:Uncharacterized protein n=1 Tax=Plasmopara halstedii TaxID=4781 RepID=A0A0P1B0K3_PLAHL|nr:uncharacterized protein PHALS_04827 [Plasmopara halstedii]CEG47680.1 hypothetical protein PHALS_04827 [Plasmopara halstedii]|eukprot:XP_024584049.1 hypothetical protein PHALS_04827 [Plasmopara halstedii]
MEVVMFIETTITTSVRFQMQFLERAAPNWQVSACAMGLLTSMDDIALQTY